MKIQSYLRRMISATKMAARVPRRGHYAAARNRPQSPSDIYTCLAPVFYLHKALGLVCFSLRKTNNSTTFQHSSRGAVYNVLILAIALVVAIGANIGQSLTVYSDQTLVTRLNDGASLNMSLLLMTIIFVKARNQNRVIESFQKLSNIDESLKILHITVPHKTNQRFLIGQQVLVICLMIMLSSIESLMSMEIADSNMVWLVLVGLGTTRFINYLSENQFIAWGLALRQRFRLLNVRMRDSTPVDIELVREFTATHSALWEVATEINSLFSLQVLIGVANCFLELLLNAFYLLRTLIISASPAGEFFYVLCFEVSLSVWAILKLILFCYTCSSVADEAKSSGYISHCIIEKIKVPHHVKELKSFSLKLLHQQVRLTACGLFPLDFSLAHTMVATVTTYLIILLQFDHMYTPVYRTHGNRTNVGI